MAMGITGEEALRKVTLAAASAQAIMQDPGAAHAFENLTKKIQVAVQTGHGLKITAKGLGSLADMGIRVDDVAKRMNVSASILAAQLKAGTVNAQRFGDALQDALIDKGAKPLQRMAGSMGNLKKLMGQNIEEMFDDLGKAAEPFLDKLRQALSLFDQSTESGRTMKSAVTAAFTQIFAWATKAVVPVEHFFLRTIIMGVKTYTLIKKHWTEIRALFIGVEPAISAVAHAFEQIEHAINVIAKLDQKMTNMLSGIGQMSRPIGKNFSDGVADGIADGTPGIKDAAKGSAMVAVDGAKAGLDAHSPSRKTFAIGQFASGGLAMGMRSRGPEVAAAGRSVAGITLRSMATSPGRQMGQSGASVGAIHLTIQAPQGVTNAEQLTEIGVATIFERLQLMVAR